MNSKLKSILNVAAKNAVNAVITNTALIAMWHSQFQVSTLNGWGHILKVTLGVILGRELMIWGPKVIQWSQSTEQPNVVAGGK